MLLDVSGVSFPKLKSDAILILLNTEDIPFIFLL